MKIAKSTYLGMHNVKNESGNILEVATTLDSARKGADSAVPGISNLPGLFSLLSGCIPGLVFASIY